MASALQYALWFGIEQIMTTPSLKRRSRWYQFRLRTLLIGVLLVSLPLSWFACRMQKARKQREAVEAIQEAGGMITYSYRVKSMNPSVPKWACAIVGDDFFFDVWAVESYTERFSDDEAVYLTRLTKLEVLLLADTQITDAGLEHLKGLSNLETLYLIRAQITDAGLEHLEGITNLKELYLYGTQVTDEGVKKLQEALPDCEILHEDSPYNQPPPSNSAPTK